MSVAVRRICRKKQGLLPLTFVNSSDYDKVQPLDKVDLKGVTVRTLPLLTCLRGFPLLPSPPHSGLQSRRPPAWLRGWMRVWRHQSEAHGTQELAEGSTLTLVAKHQDGSSDEIPLTHTFNAPQIAWFKAGSALNVSLALRACHPYTPWRWQSVRHTAVLPICFQAW